MNYFFKFSELPKLNVPDDMFDIRFIHTENITVAFNELKAGAEVYAHQHVHETIDYVQEGELEMIIENETVRMNAGMVSRIPSNILHSAKAITDCKVINIFILREKILSLKKTKISFSIFNFLIMPHRLGGGHSTFQPI